MPCFPKIPVSIPTSAGTKANWVSCALPTRSIVCALAGRPGTMSMPANAVAKAKKRAIFLSIIASTKVFRTGLFQLTPPAGANQLVKSPNLVRQPVVVAPVLVLRKRERPDRLVHAHTLVDRGFDGCVFVREHCGQFFHVGAR